MGFRIMQLQYEPCKDEAKIVNGFEMWLSTSQLRRNFFGYANYAIIQSFYTPEEKRLVTSVHEYDVKELNDGFKKITLAISDTTKVEEEKAIFLMIGIGAESIKADNINKIAGRFPEEGIFVLKPNDKIFVTRGSLTEEFAALQFENKMYLVKVHTD